MALKIEDKNSSPTSDKKTMAVYLPQDVIFQILTWVPIKFGIRFKCVSKQWNSFLMSDRFKKMHSRNLLKYPHLEDQNLLFYSREATAFYTIDCESPPYKAPCTRRLPQFVASPPEYIHILASYHGLVCLGIKPGQIYCHDHDSKYSDIILWNPLTTEYKRLSKPSNPDPMKCYQDCGAGRGYGLYYSSCEDDYKLLVVTYFYNVYIYSLKSDSWRNLNEKRHFQEGDWRPGFCLDGNLYFLPVHPALGSIRFDTTTERFHKIKTPPLYGSPYSTTFTVHKGSIHFCLKYDSERTSFLKSTCIDLWKFNLDGDIWSKVETYQLMPNSDIRKLFPVHLMINGNWLMKNGDRICQVDLKKDKDGHQSNGENKSKGNCYDVYKLYYSGLRGYPEKVFYTETFVSPNQYMK